LYLIDLGNKLKNISLSKVPYIIVGGIWKFRKYY
jgi:hypothetical protein